MRSFEYYTPRSLEEALSLIDNQRKTVKILAGGTDLTVQLKEASVCPDVLIDVKNIPELNRLEWEETKTLHIGASVPLTKVIAFPPIKESFGILCQACSLIGSVQIKNRATVGGNICNAAPSADSSPALLCLGAKAVLMQSKGTRKVPLEQFFSGPGKTVLAPNELLVEIEIPAPPTNSSGCYLRHTPREEMDISVAGVASMIVLAPDNVCQMAKIALGAVAPTPVMVPGADVILAGKMLTEHTIEEAAKEAAKAASPITDVRGSAEYRRELVKVLTRRTLKKAMEILSSQVK